MILLFIDAVVLVGMIKLMGDEDMGIGGAIVLAIVAAIGIFAAAFGLAQVMPPILALILAGILGAAGVGIAVSAMYGLEIKRAMVVGVVFMAVHLGFGIAFTLAAGG